MSRLKKDKTAIFKTLMANRVGWSTASVYAVSVIDIVFNGDMPVRDRWEIYYEKSCIQNPDETRQKQAQTAHYKLLEAAATSLGYKDKTTWETIQNPYIPIGMVNAAQQRQMIQSGQALLAGSMPGALNRMMGGNSPRDQVKAREGKPDARA